MPRQRWQDRLIREWVHDPYQSKHKLPDPTTCPQCGAVCHQGRWTWLTRPEMAHEELCPACQRVRDKYPAGFLSLHGGLLDQHKQEIVHLARRIGEALHRPYQGKLDVHYIEEGSILDVHWKRER